MADKIELTLLGFASVVDTVLILVMLERVNRPLIPLWLAVLLVATWTWHVGSFSHVLLRDSIGQIATRVDCTTLSVMAMGLLVLPSGFLHGALRLRSTGPTARPPWNLRYAALYLPVLLLIPVTGAIFRSGDRDFLLSTTQFHQPFLIWLTASNFTAAAIFWSLRNRLDLPGGRNLLLQVTCCLVIVTGLAIAYAMISPDSASVPFLRMLVTLSLLVPTICFAWSVYHRRLMPLILERTLGYGAILVAILLLNRVVLSSVTSQLTEDLSLDFVLIEFVIILAVVLALRPLRNRVRESLRYLLGTNISKVRDETRQLSSRLLRRSNDRVDDTSQWFAEAIQSVMHAEYVWLGLSERGIFEASPLEANPKYDHVVNGPITPGDVYEIPFSDDELWIDQTRCRDADITEQLRALHASAAFRFTFKSIQGRLLLGSLDGGDRYSTEQLNSLTLLLDQFAVIVHNRELEEARLLAERRAMQQEKLSVLGLMSGSLAHELKNPLSSIKTISTLLIEELDESSEHRKDMELIVSEIDRLTETTNGLLQYSRPADATSTGACPEAVIERLLRILRYLARQHGVDLTTNFEANDTPTAGNDATLSEIFFNLIKNAIEAASQHSPSPVVTINTSSQKHSITVSVIDNGPGIPFEVRDTLYEPFVTAKEKGTGLGLYLVAERVRDIGGSIDCFSNSATGTEFRVEIPRQNRNGTNS
jgi:C4-dicarboxylate-specific signal transduction histidine kinase